MSSFNEGDTRLLKTYKLVALKKICNISIQKLNNLYLTNREALTVLYSVIKHARSG